MLRPVERHFPLAHRMPEQIVDLLETIKIDAEDREAAAALAGIVEGRSRSDIRRVSSSCSASISMTTAMPSSCASPRSRFAYSKTQSAPPPALHQIGS